MNLVLNVNIIMKEAACTKEVVQGMADSEVDDNNKETMKMQWDGKTVNIDL